MGYHHLTRDKRCQTQTLKDSGKSIQFIAAQLCVHRSTIYRELKRNKQGSGYSFAQAHKLALRRKFRNCSNGLKLTQEVISIIEEKLHLQWSPEQISGWLRKNDPSRAVSHETIYKYVWKDKRNGGSLFNELRHHGKKYNKRSSNKAGRGSIPDRIDISERPLIVNEKIRMGDWEADTIIGACHRGVIVSIVERYSKFTLLKWVPNKTADQVERALVMRLAEFKEFVTTITTDNGKEFANHRKFGAQLEAEVYFATPYHSWERGLNEHTNGLVRQYLPKGQRLDDVDHETITEIEKLLNDRPRKVLQFRSPIEVFNEYRKKSQLVALRT